MTKEEQAVARALECMWVVQMDYSIKGSKLKTVKFLDSTYVVYEKDYVFAKTLIEMCKK